MDASKPVTTPVPFGSKLTLYAGDLYLHSSPYHSIVGALRILTVTRHDITYAVNYLCQFIHRPTIEHWKAIKLIYGT